MDQQAEKKIRQKELTGLSRRTREEIAKWHQMTALRFQIGGRHQTCPASLWGMQECIYDVKVWMSSNKLN